MRRQSVNQYDNIGYPNIQVHGLDVLPSLRGVSFQVQSGELFAVMSTSRHEGSVLMETLAGLRERISGEVLINGQHISRRELRKICSYVPAADRNSLDDRMSVQNSLSFHAALRGPYDRTDLRERVKYYINFKFIRNKIWIIE